MRVGRQRVGRSAGLKPGDWSRPSASRPLGAGGAEAVKPGVEISLGSGDWRCPGVQPGSHRGNGLRVSVHVCVENWTWSGGLGRFGPDE